MTAPVIAILGGTSAFGRLWQRYFEGKGLTVIIAGRNTELSMEAAASRADIVIFSISIRSTVSVIERILPTIPAGKLVMDFTGIKSKASAALSKYTMGEVVATHPMFGPWVTSLHSQNIAFDPICPGEKWALIANLWREDGASLIELSSSKHDELVAIVQSSVHIINLMLGHILVNRGIDLREIIKISTPNSRMQLCILGRFLNQEASLYSDMQIENTMYSDHILPELRAYIEHLSDIIQKRDAQAFESEFNIIKGHVGNDILSHALMISSEFDTQIKKVL